SVSPETDARASTTRRLQPPSASLVLWRKPRNPPSVAACALDPVVDATAAARSELRSRLPFTAVYRTVHWPQHLHGSSPSTLDARVPAIQRPSARLHRTVDNSLITSRIEYSIFLTSYLKVSFIHNGESYRVKFHTGAYLTGLGYQLGLFIRV